MRLSIERQTAITIVSLSLITALIIGLVLLPTIQHIKDLRQQTYNLRLFLEKKYERSVHLHASLGSIRDLNQKTARYQEYIFHAADELRLVTQLEALAAATHVTDTIASANLDKRTADYIDLSLSVTGSYRDTLNFFERLERTVPYFLIIKNFQLSPGINRSAPAAAEAIANLHLDIRVYVE